MLIGAETWGIFSDRFGRRKAYLFSNICVLVFSICSALSPSYWVLLISRTLVGFGVSGSHVAFTLFAEYLPVSKRGAFLVLFELFWAFGSMMEALLNWLVLPTLGWRWMLGISSIPVILLFFIYFWVPESARWLFVAGRKQEAIDQLILIAKQNNKLTSVDKTEIHFSGEQSRGNILQLFAPSLRLTTFLLSFIWFANTFIYYGVVLIVPVIFNQTDSSQRLCENGIAVFTSSDYLDIFISSTGEIPGLIVAAFCIQKLGRKSTQTLLFGVIGILSLLLLIPDEGRAVVTVILFFIRACIAGVFQVTFVYTPEVYPTTLRGSGMGFCSGFSRLGGMVTPYVALVLSHYSMFLAVSLYALFSFCSSLCAWLLPFETKGKRLNELIKDIKNEVDPASSFEE